ncbi:MAG: SMP-30/gluconolactonase/LRE family protein [bacterium]|nr:SMP-30/gluconolactonase/LRE family protein [bacterium]
MQPIRTIVVALLPACSALVSCAGEPATGPPRPLEPEVRKLAGDMGFTEGPVWLPEERMLVFSDIPASKLMRWSEADGLGVFRASENSNGNLLDESGRLLSCQHGARNIVRTEADGSLTVLAERFEGKRFNSPNDVAVESDGTLWFTDPPWGLTRQVEGKELDGHFVFRLEPKTGAVKCVLRDHVMPNGIALAPDERTLYVADTGGHPSHPDPSFRDRPATLTAYAVGPDKELDPTPRWRVETRCDGMCVDERGNVYATGERGVTLWSPEGAALGEIPVPEQPANVCFGGPELRTLFITARTSLYAIELNVAGKG